MNLIGANPGTARIRLDYAGPRQRAGGPPGGAGCLPVGQPLSARRLIFVALFCATLLLPTLDGRRVLTKHEVFAAEPAREMLHGGSASNWIIPRFAGVPRTVKPPTMGWLIAGSMALFHSESEWFVRLPTGLSAILMTVLIADLAARWLGPRVGLIAGLMQGTFAYALVQGRLAEADMPMAAAVCLAMYAFGRGVVLRHPPPEYRGREQAAPLRPAWPVPRYLPILFYLGAGASFLLKGVGIVFILASVAAFIICSAAEGRDWRRCVRFLWNPAGLLLLAVMLLAWPLAAWRADPHIFNTFRREIVGRASGELGGEQPWYFYAGVVPAMLMPWTPFGIGALVRGVRRSALRGPVGQFLLCWFVPGLLILSTSAWKHHHYVIPMLPAATLVTAAGMDLWLRGLKPQKSWLGPALWFAGCAVVAAGIGRLAKTGRAEMLVTLAVLAVGVTIALCTATRGRAFAAAATIFATAWAVSFGVGFAVLPAFEDYRWSVQLARRTNREVPAGEPIYLLGLKEHNTAFYLRLPLARVDKHVDSWEGDLPEGRYYALCPASLLPTLRKPWLDGSIYDTYPTVTVLDRSEKLHKTEMEGDRPTLVEIYVPVPFAFPPRPGIDEP